MDGFPWDCRNAPVHLLSYVAQRTCLKSILESILKSNEEARKEFEENQKLQHDPRITKLGNFIRKASLDELPQMINILKGELSFVGVRPESPKYVARYNKEMVATLLLPAGVTSPASILFKNESEMLKDCEDYDETYVNEILPKKMKYNLEYIKNFGFWSDIKIMFQTVLAVIKK